MAIRKQKSKATGKVSWLFVFDAPGSTRANRKQIWGYGFATKKDAQDGEAKRRIEIQQEYQESLKTVPDTPATLQHLLDAFCKEHAEKNLAPKTIERYYDMVKYLSPALLAMPLPEITSLHLTREWNRLKESGGHHRKTKAARPLGAKTVRNIAGVVSSAFAKGLKWGIVESNPVHNSDLPKARKKEGQAFSTTQQELLLAASAIHWALPVILELSAGTGARRGEVLALRWSDIQAGKAFISRSLTQTKEGLFFKRPKNEKARVIALPTSTKAMLAEHRVRQEAFSLQFGDDYKADLDLIIANPDGTPLKPDSISGTVSNLFRRLKLPKGTSLHTLRHTHGSHLLAAGMELPAVSARLGHSNPFVTATIYSHMLTGRDEEAAKKWEEYQKRNTAKPMAEKPLN